MSRTVPVTVAVLCLTIVLSAMGWMTVTTRRLERVGAEARHQAAFEQRVRLALWRMDSALASLLAEVNSVPTVAFRRGQIEPSGPRHVEAYLELAPDAEGRVVTASGPADSAMADTQWLPPVETLLADLPAPLTWTAGSPMMARSGGSGASNLARGSETAGEPASTEFAQRSQVVLHNANVAAAVQNRAGPSRSADVTTTGVGLFMPHWIDGRLVLLRRAKRGGAQLVQGCVIDWPGLRGQLLDSVADLLADAALLPVQANDDAPPSRRLAALPVRLEPGAQPAADGSGWSPVTLMLTIAWAGVIVATGAVIVLIVGITRLSERRAAFVGAVTHELRTPLTTLRMYAEMLRNGMIPADQRHAYLDTLHREANRLGELVENVLAYARLERRPQRRTPTDVTVEELVDCIRPRLDERMADAGMTLNVDLEGIELAEPAGPHRIPTDPEAVEQILFNLVDNACKYAANGERGVDVAVKRDRNHLTIAVRDYGPGMPRDVRKRLFRPFSKSAHEAADSAPGVGLGLALSRRLARQLGGDLRLRDNGASGACFVLTLPASMPSRNR